MRYNLIWIDDEHEIQATFMDEAELAGFDITPFKTSRDGMEFLRSNLHDIDAVILDAKVFKESTGETASTRGLSASLSEISTLSGQHGRKEIPCVIFTGQPDLLGNESFLDMIDGIPVCSKSDSNDRIFEKLHALIEESQNTTLRNRYPEGYEACRKVSATGECWRLLMPILGSIQSCTRLHPEPYNDLRKVLELVFRMLHSKGVIHERLIEGGIVNIQGSSLFLAGMEAKLHREGIGVKAKGRIIPNLLGQCVRLVMDLTQTGSHTANALEINNDQPSIPAVAKFVPQHHLQETAALMTLDFVVWAAAYVNENPDLKTNMGYWEPVTQEAGKPGFETMGIVINQSPRGDFFIKPDDSTASGSRNICISRHQVHSGELKTGTRVVVVTTGKLLRNDAWEARDYKLV